MKNKHHPPSSWISLLILLLIIASSCGGSGSSDDSAGQKAGFTISAVSGNTTEKGAAATFTIKLNSQPNGDVVVKVTSSDTGEGTVVDPELFFSTYSWETSKIVTITGVDDASADGDQNYTIQLTIDGQSTYDTTGYADLTTDAVSVVNIDDDRQLPRVAFNSITATDSSVIFTWSEPDAGSFSHVQFVVNGNTTRVDKGTKTHEINGLSAGTRYTFVVTAVDIVDGASEPHTLAIKTASSGNTIEYTAISTAAELDAVRNNLNGMYLLTGDIDLSGYSDWDPIGKSSASFTGRFLGNTHVISNLTIVGDGANYLGLFGYIWGATIQNLTLEDVTISGGGDFVGGLVGYMSKGTIAYSHASGTITGTNGVGGLVGYTDNSKIENSHASASVSGTDDVGGLANQMVMTYIPPMPLGP